LETPSAEPAPTRRGRPFAAPRFSVEKTCALRVAYADGASYRELGKREGCGKGAVAAAVHGDGVYQSIPGAIPRGTRNGDPRVAAAARAMLAEGKTVPEIVSALATSVNRLERIARG
jgi:hypothetical protein